MDLAGDVVVGPRAPSQPVRAGRPRGLGVLPASPSLHCRTLQAPTLGVLTCSGKMLSKVSQKGHYSVWELPSDSSSRNASLFFPRPTPYHSCPFFALQPAPYLLRYVAPLECSSADTVDQLKERLRQLTLFRAVVRSARGFSTERRGYILRGVTSDPSNGARRKLNG